MKKKRFTEEQIHSILQESEAGFKNEEWFINLNDARVKIAQWRNEYNEERAHSSLGDLSPYEFIRKIA